MKLDAQVQASNRNYRSRFRCHNIVHCIRSHRESQVQTSILAVIGEAYLVRHWPNVVLKRKIQQTLTL